MLCVFFFSDAVIYGYPIYTTEPRISASQPNTLRGWVNPRVRAQARGHRCVRARAGYAAGRIAVAAEMARSDRLRVARAWDPVARGSGCPGRLETCDGGGGAWFVGARCLAADHRGPGGGVAVVRFRVAGCFPDLVVVYEKVSGGKSVWFSHFLLVDFQC